MSIVGAEATLRKQPQPEDFIKDVPLELFGGLASEMSPANLPQGASPLCQDVDFELGDVFTRAGLTALFAGQLPAGCSVNYVKTYTLPTGGKQLLLLDSLGNFYFEDTSNNPGVLNLIDTVTPGCYAKSITAFEREYIAFHNRTTGLAVPRQWDGANFDRVTQNGPGAPPSVAGISNSIAITSITQPAAVSLNGGALLWSDGAGSRNHGNVITIQYKQQSAGSPDPGVIVGANVYLSGFPTVSGLNADGTYTIVAVGTVIGENHPDGSNVVWYYFSVIASTTAAQNYFLAAGPQYQLTLATVTLASPNSQAQPNTTLGITGATPAAWNMNWTIDTVPITSALNITNTSLTNSAGPTTSGVATITYTLQTNPATNAPYAQPTAGQLITIVGTTNGGGIFNVVNAPIQSVTPGGSGGTLTILITSPNVAAAADSGTSTIQGTQLTIDPGQLVIQNPTQFGGNPILGNTTVGGQAAVAGIFTAGQYQCVAMFLTRNGALTRCSPPVTFNLNGTESAITASNIATGPPNVIARVLAFTGPGGAFFFYIPNTVTTTVAGVTSTSTATVIRDKVTTTATFSFSLATLLSSIAIDQPGSDQFALEVLSPVLGFDLYADRVASWGELNAVQEFLNMGFDGGFANGAVPVLVTGAMRKPGIHQGPRVPHPATQNAHAPAVPLGWTQATQPSNTGGGFCVYDSVSGINASWIGGGMYCVIGDAATPILGMITQPAYQTFENVPILLPNTQYSVRVMLATSGNPTQGNAVIELFSPSQGSLGTFTVPVSKINAGSLRFATGILATTPPSIPTDVLLRLYVSGTLTANAIIAFDELEIFPTQNPYRTAEVRMSYADNPEGFDGVTGLVGISKFANRLVTATGQIRDSFYGFADPGIVETSDNGTTEPFGWAIETRSTSVGSPSVDGVASDQRSPSGAAGDWLFIADRAGAHLFNGSEPRRISQEIQPNWDAMDTTASSKFANVAWVLSDIVRRRVLFGIPINGAEVPNQTLMMNYVDLNSAYEIMEQKPLHISYAGRMVSWDMSRKWSPWNIYANCASICQTQDNRQWIFFGPSMNEGKIFKLDPFQQFISDDGHAINSIYYPFFFVNRDMEAGLQLGMGRKSYTYLRLFIAGQGTVLTTAQSDAIPSPRVKGLPPRTLSPSPSYDTEIGMNWEGDRTTFGVQTAAPGSWFRLSKMVVSMRQSPWSPVRGRV